jgi:hypothetical protein
MLMRRACHCTYRSSRQQSQQTAVHTAHLSQADDRGDKDKASHLSCMQVMIPENYVISMQTCTIIPMQTQDDWRQKQTGKAVSSVPLLETHTDEDYSCLTALPRAGKKLHQLTGYLQALTTRRTVENTTCVGRNTKARILHDRGYNQNISHWRR